jgi:hypothetical protein
MISERNPRYEWVSLRDLLMPRGRRAGAGGEARSTGRRAGGVARARPEGGQGADRRVARARTGGWPGRGPAVGDVPLDLRQVHLARAARPAPRAPAGPQLGDAEAEARRPALRPAHAARMARQPSANGMLLQISCSSFYTDHERAEAGASPGGAAWPIRGPASRRSAMGLFDTRGRLLHELRLRLGLRPAGPQGLTWFVALSIRRFGKIEQKWDTAEATATE